MVTGESDRSLLEAIVNGKRSEVATFPAVVKYLSAVEGFSVIRTARGFVNEESEAIEPSAVV